MEAVVSDIIKSRMEEPGGAATTAALSLVAHAMAIAVLVLVPGLLPKKTAPPAVVMNISLGGSPGPKIGGMTTIGGRNFVAAAPTAVPKVEKVALPSVKAEPKMVLPIPDPKIKPTTPPKSTAASKDPAGRVEGRGAETQKGSSAVETGARGMGFGLSNAGGGGIGGSLDVQNFCCPEYLTDMVSRIKQNWQQQQEATGTVLMKFTVLRSGQITDIQAERSSNIFSLDQASSRALYLTGKLQPLPQAFPDDHLTVHLYFEYQRR